LFFIGYFSNIADGFSLFEILTNHGLLNFDRSKFRPKNQISQKIQATLDRDIEEKKNLPPFAYPLQ
jgi:hypothetical protein